MISESSRPYGEYMEGYDRYSIYKEARKDKDVFVLYHSEWKNTSAGMQEFVYTKHGEASTLDALKAKLETLKRN